MSEEERKVFEKDLKAAETEGNEAVAKVFTAMIEAMEKVVGKTLTDENDTPLTRDQNARFIAEKATNFRLSSVTANLKSEDPHQEYRGDLQGVLAGGGNRNRPA